MKCLCLLRIALALGVGSTVPATWAAKAASADEEDEQPLAVGKIADAGTRQSAPEIAEASLEAVHAIERMKVPPGLVIKLWAAEPMLANPVAFSFDERGRIFVAETHRYRSSVLDIRHYMWMLEDDLACRTVEDRSALIKKAFGPTGERELSIESEILRLVVDTDGDGVADKSHVYADGFNSPLDGIASGALARRGKVWFTNIPHVWQFTGETQAVTRTPISSGYGVRFNFTGHDLHGLVLGPDGKIYFSNGDRGATVKTKEGGVIETADTGAVFRCNPDGSQMELFAHGLRNPQSLVFNEYGDLLTGDNDCDHGDEERLVHVVEGGDSGWRVGYQFAPLGRAGPWNLDRLWHQRHRGQPAYLLPPVANIEDGPSGIEYHPGTGLNASYAGTLFITHFKGAISHSGIYAYNLKQKGASYEVTDAKPFLTSALPTDVKFGPDGRLYFSDWADGWPKSKRGRIYAISDPAQKNTELLRQTQRIIGGDWTKRNEDELAALLSHPDWRVRLETQFELAERGRVDVLARVATKTDGSPLARRHAIWGLGQVAEKNRQALEPLRTLANDGDSEIRAQSLKVLGDRRDAASGDRLAAALKDPNPRVKFFAAQSLGKLKRAADASALLEALRANNDEDHYVRHALAMALVSGRNRAAMTAAITDPSAAVRRGVLLALRRLKSPAVAKFLADADSKLVREAALAINDEPINEAMPVLGALLGQPLSDDAVIYRALNAHFRLGRPENAAAIAAYAAKKDAPAKLRAEALEQLSLWPKPPQRDRLVGVYRPLPLGAPSGLEPTAREREVAVNALQPILSGLLASNAPKEVQTAALEALQTLEIKGASDALFAAVANGELSGETRSSALAALDKIRDLRLSEAVRLASESSSSVLRLASLPIAGRLSPEAAAPVLSNLAAKGTPEEKKAAFRALMTLKHPSANVVLAQQLALLDEGKVAPAVQLELVTAAARREDPVLKEMLAKREASVSARSDPLGPFRIALAGGDRMRGERIFKTQPVLACIRCHRAGADGGDAGPNLADVGSKYTREYLLEALIKPNAKIAPGFDTVVITLESGAVVAGVVANESATLLSLRTADNRLVPVTKSQIAKREGAPSGMPEIYASILTKSEIRDLIEYMASLRGNPIRTDQAPPRALRGLPPRISE